MRFFSVQFVALLLLSALLGTLVAGCQGGVSKEATSEPNTSSVAEKRSGAKAKTSEQNRFAHLVALANSGNFNEVIPLAKRILTKEPANVGARSYLGWAYAETKAWAQAAPELEQVLKLDPKHQDALATLGWVYAEQKQWAKSIDASKKLLALNPNHAHAHANLGWAYDALQKPAESIVAYKQAIKYKPELFSAYYSLGRVYCKKGKASDAEALLNRLRVKEPDAKPFSKKLSEIIVQGCS